MSNEQNILELAERERISEHIRDKLGRRPRVCEVLTLPELLRLDEELAQVAPDRDKMSVAIYLAQREHPWPAPDPIVPPTDPAEISW